ncbi:LysR family transcriptional regulator [Microvirga puerhi]|uniref:LysR family transcriptional regulator n=1 Tax=Microvirga puerhi TaxID=2876078 RepID=A0ABS7VTI8_9HYPH|nr:LysR family transcriptional regulator [Microvirga puerhi]MBZ6078883.1 LysR family transcriptional regulator [Microvirga puerhi]
MQPKSQRGVPAVEHETPAALGRPDWDGIRIFLEVARRGSFRSAAEHLDQSINALRRRIDDLERKLGTVLLTRHVDGIRVTVEGSKILAVAERMEAAAYDIARVRDQALPVLSGEVRIAVTEGLGTFWLAPRLVEFQRSYPRLIIDLSCAMRSADVLRMEADASVQLTQPTAPDLKIVKLGRLHSMPYVARSYIDTYGIPHQLQDILHHRVVLQLAEQTTTQEVFAKLAGGVPQEGFVAMRTNVSSAHYWAIAKGAGIGWLPTYASAIGARIIPLDLDLRFSFDIWLTYHPDAKRIPRVQRCIEWIIESFDPRHFPWFRDEFIHPKDLPQDYRGQPLVNWFEGFTGAV